MVLDLMQVEFHHPSRLLWQFHHILPLLYTFRPCFQVVPSTMCFTQLGRGGVKFTLGKSEHIKQTNIAVEEP